MSEPVKCRMCGIPHTEYCGIHEKYGHFICWRCNTKEREQKEYYAALEVENKCLKDFCKGVKVPDNVGGLAVVYKKLLILKEALHGITPPKSWPSLAVETALAQFEEEK